MKDFNELRKLKESGKVFLLDPNRRASQRYICQMLQKLGNKAMTGDEIRSISGFKKYPSKIRYYERLGYLKAITIEGEKNIYYVKGKKATNYFKTKEAKAKWLKFIVQ